MPSPSRCKERDGCLEQSSKVFGSEDCGPNRTLRLQPQKSGVDNAMFLQVIATPGCLADRGGLRCGRSAIAAPQIVSQGQSRVEPHFQMWGHLRSSYWLAFLTRVRATMARHATVSRGDSIVLARFRIRQSVMSVASAQCAISLLRKVERRPRERGFHAPKLQLRHRSISCRAKF